MTARERTIVAVIAGVFTVLVGASPLFTAAPRAQDPAQGTPFIYLVRTDFFAGLRGDTVRLARGMKFTEATLAADPNHAEALVWHGMGLVYLAGQTMGNDPEKAIAFLRQGLTEMERAAVLAPGQTAVLIPRSSALTMTAAAMPESFRAQAQELLRTAVDGFEQSLAIQAPYFGRLSLHRRGELLGALAETWSRLGETEKSRGYLQRMVKELPDSAYRTRARAWLDEGPEHGALTCVSCHHGPGT